MALHEMPDGNNGKLSSGKRTSETVDPKVLEEREKRAKARMEHAKTLNPQLAIPTKSGPPEGQDGWE